MFWVSSWLWDPEPGSWAFLPLGPAQTGSPGGSSTAQGPWEGDALLSAALGLAVSLQHALFSPSAEQGQD